MGIKADVQEALKKAMKERQHERLECLRMGKAALLLKEKEGASGTPLTEEQAALALRGEIKKRQQSIETYRGYAKQDEVEKLEREIAVLEEFLPKQLSEEALEDRVRRYVAEHPEMNQPGPLTGAMKKELGDLADGKMLNQVCRRVLES